MRVNLSRAPGVAAALLLFALAGCGDEPGAAAPPPGPVVDVRDLEALALGLEDTFTGLLGLSNRLRCAELRVLLYDDEAKWEARLKEAFHSGEVALLGGFYSPESKTVEIFVWDPYTLKRVTTHEVCHHLVDVYLGETDVWLDEGLATWFELHTEEGKLHDTAHVALRMRMRHAIRDLVKAGEMLTVRETVRTRDFGDFRYMDVERAGARYAASYALIEFLWATGKDRVWPLLRDFIARRATTSAEDAFKSAAGCAMHVLDDALAAHFLASE